MAKDHGARQQKKVAKQKAKRAEKRSSLMRRDSQDPTVRLQRAETWPIVHTLVGKKLWQDGIGYLAIARQESNGRVIYALFLVDVFCLGVKDALWEAGTPGEFHELIRKLGSTQPMVPISPSCLAKIIKGGVEYALSFGFHPHPDFRHASKLLAGIDPSTCTQEFTFGRDGKPFYVQGPNETFLQAQAILRRVSEAGGYYIASLGDPGPLMITEMGDEDDEFEALDEEL